MRGGADKLVGFLRRGVGETSAPQGGLLGQAFLAGGAQHQRAGGGRGLRRRNFGFEGLSQRDMSVRAAKAEGIHPGQPRRVALGQFHRFNRDFEVQIVEGNMRVQLVHMQRGRVDAFFQRHLRLEQTDEAGRRLKMPEIGLGRTDRQRRRAAATEHFANRVGLERVANGRARAMRLHKGEVVGVELQLPRHLAQKVRLPVRRRHRHADGAAIGVDPAADHHGPHRVAIRGGDILPAQHKGDRAFGANIPIGARVERLAEPFRRQHGCARKPDKGRRRQQRVHAADDGGFNLARTQRLNRQMQRIERRGTGGIDSKARPFEVEKIGNAVRYDRQGVAGHELGVDRGKIRQEPPGMIRAGGADIDAGAPFRQIGGLQSGMLDRLPHRLQQDALLRVHLRRFARRNAEKARVEIPDVFKLTGGEGIGPAQRGLVRVQEAFLGPAFRLNFGDHATPVFKHGPECGRAGGAWQFAGVSRYGYVIAGLRHLWRHFRRSRLSHNPLRRQITG